MSNQVKKITQGIIQYLKASQASELLPEIVAELQKQSRLYDRRFQALVASPYKLSVQEINQIQQTLQNIFNKKLKIINFVDPTIIAGLKIAVQDKVIDLSVDRTLQNLKNKISHD